jgi:hypothetical protein
VDVPIVRNAFRDSPLGDCPYKLAWTPTEKSHQLLRRR